jgi:hypothetical protein
MTTSEQTFPVAEVINVSKRVAVRAGGVKRHGAWATLKRVHETEIGELRFCFPLADGFAVMDDANPLHLLANIQTRRLPSHRMPKTFLVRETDSERA